MTKLSFKDLYDDVTSKNDYWEEEAKLEFAIELNRVLKRKNLSNKQLADKIGTSKSYITKVFKGNANFTLESMVKLVRALDCKLSIHIADESERVRWFGVHKGLRSADFIMPQDKIRQTVVQATKDTHRNVKKSKKVFSEWNNCDYVFEHIGM